MKKCITGYTKMKIDVVCVGKIKESFYRDAIDEFTKRLSRYSTLNIYEVKDEKTPDNPSEHEKELILNAEGERISKYIAEDSYIVTLCIEGKMLSSEELSAKFNEIELSRYSHMQFIIGGSLGLSDNIKKKSHFKLSFSKMTFPHMLMRVILLEQIYRAFRIKNNEPYHK